VYPVVASTPAPAPTIEMKYLPAEGRATFRGVVMPTLAGGDAITAPTESKTVKRMLRFDRPALPDAGVGKSRMVAVPEALLWKYMNSLSLGDLHSISIDAAGTRQAASSWTKRISARSDLMSLFQSEEKIEEVNSLAGALHIRAGFSRRLSARPSCYTHQGGCQPSCQSWQLQTWSLSVSHLQAPRPCWVVGQTHLITPVILAVTVAPSAFSAPPTDAASTVLLPWS
jgi:hypothetical protein